MSGSGGEIMSGPRGSRRGTIRSRGIALRRTGGAVAALATVAVAVSACSGGGSPDGSAASSSGPATYQQTVAYSQCMRSHGDPGFPDPKQGPGCVRPYPGTPQTQQYLSGPAYNTAQHACKKLQPRVGMNPAERRAALDHLLTLARCMRAHGITNFPDPTTNGSGINLTFGGSDGVDPNSPQFKTAQQACHMPGP